MSDALLAACARHIPLGPEASNNAARLATCTHLHRSITHLRLQRCDLCGGYGHGNNHCGLRARIYALAGTADPIRTIIQGFVDSSVGARRLARRHNAPLAAAINLPPRQVGRKRARLSRSGSA